MFISDSKDGLPSYTTIMADSDGQQPDQPNEVEAAQDARSQRETELNEREKEVREREIDVTKREKDVRTREQEAPPESERLLYRVHKSKRYRTALLVKAALWGVQLIWAIALLTIGRGNIVWNCQDEVGTAAWTIVIILVTTLGTFGLHQFLEFLLLLWDVQEKGFTIIAWTYLLAAPCLTICSVLLSLGLSSMCDIPNHDPEISGPAWRLG